MQNIGIIGYVAKYGFLISLRISTSVSSLKVYSQHLCSGMKIIKSISTYLCVEFLLYTKNNWVQRTGMGVGPVMKKRIAG